MRKVIVNADDFGYSRGINWGIIDAYQESILTSTTLMANMPGFDHAVELTKAYPGLAVGVHLVLSCGKPLLGNHKTLINEDGSFKKQDFFKHDTYDLEEIYREWEAQIEKVLAAGLKPTHLDSHHHVHTFQNNATVIEALARKYNLPLRTNYQASDDMRGVDCFIWDFDDCGSRTKEEDALYSTDLLNQIMTHDITEIMCHPGYLDYTVSNNSSWLVNRINVLEFMMHSDFCKKIKHHEEIELISYREL